MAADWSGTGAQLVPARAEQSSAEKFTANRELIHPHPPYALDYIVARVGGFGIKVVVMSG